MASYTALPDLTTGDLVTEAWIDGIRNNADYLLNPNFQTTDSNTFVSITTSSFVNLAGASAVVTGHGGPLLVMFSCNVTGFAGCQFDLSVDGASQSQGTGLIQKVLGNIDGAGFTRIVTGLASGAHTLSTQWRARGTNATAQVTGIANFAAIEV